LCLNFKKATVEKPEGTSVLTPDAPDLHTLTGDAGIAEYLPLTHAGKRGVVHPKTIYSAPLALQKILCYASEKT
jgi:hypothetical protein